MFFTKCPDDMEVTNVVVIIVVVVIVVAVVDNIVVVIFRVTFHCNLLFCEYCVCQFFGFS